MSKLSKLKKFYTLEEAVTYLSKNLGESVSQATLYQLIADKQLTLSVRLINQAYALKGQVFECKDGDSVEFKTELATGKVLEKPYFDYVTDDNSLPLSFDKYFVYDNKAHIVDGIWDLAMIGEESLKVEYLYQNEVNGPKPTLTDTWGFYLKQGEIICRLVTKSTDNIIEIQSSIDEIYDFLASSRELSVEEYMHFIADNEDLLSEDEFESLEYLTNLTELPDDSLKFYEDSRSLEEHSCQLVIKTSELIGLINSTETEPSVPNMADKLKVKEHYIFLILLYVLLKEQNIDPFKKGVTSSVKLMTDNAGYPLSDNTIRTVLKNICSELESPFFKQICTELKPSFFQSEFILTKERNKFIKFLYALLKEQGINPLEDGVVFLILTKVESAGYSLSEDDVYRIIDQTIDLIA